MDNIETRAIGISNKFLFSEFKTSAAATHEGDAADETMVACCKNHLDVEFMALLESGAHLDIKKFPL